MYFAHEDRPPEVTPAAAGEAPSAAGEPTDPPLPPREENGKLLLPSTVSPAFLSGLIASRTNLQAAGAVEAYLDKWMEVSGKVIQASKVLHLTSVSIMPDGYLHGPTL
jgi:N-dimethylarginine dimethylaminohydrolase